MLAVRRAKHDSQFAMWLARIGNSAETSTNETRVNLCKGVSIYTSYVNVTVFVTLFCTTSLRVTL